MATTWGTAYKQGHPESDDRMADVAGEIQREGAGLGMMFVVFVVILGCLGWYSIAHRSGARTNDAEALMRLGLSYNTGEGVPQNYARAAVYYRKAAEGGNPEAPELLSGLYFYGLGVPQDYAEAYFWVDIAAANRMPGQQTASTERDWYASHLTRTVLLETQERARKWLEAHPSN